MLVVQASGSCNIGRVESALKIGMAIEHEKAAIDVVQRCRSTVVAAQQR